jgi:hypothetical protein
LGCNFYGQVHILGGKGTNVPHELGMAAPPGTTALAGAAGPAGAAGLGGTAGLQVRPAVPGVAAPAPCQIIGPNQVLPRVQTLDEQD